MRTILLLALMAGAAAALPLPATADTLAAYARARAAEGDKRVDAAARQYAEVLAGNPGNATTTLRVWRGAMLAGDLTLARKAAADLAATGQALPAEAWLLALADAIHNRDARATAIALDKLGIGAFRFIAPIARGWTAFDAGGDAMKPLAGEHAAGSQRLFDENRALLLIAGGRPDEGAEALQALLRDSSGGLDLRYAAAELLAGQNRPATAQALLRGDEPAVAYFRAHFQPAQPSAAFGLSRLFTRIAADLDDPRVSSIAIAYCRAALVLDPQDDRARLLLGQALSRIGAYDAAIATFDAIGPDSPFHLMTQIARVNTLDARGDEDAALAAARVLSQYPQADDDVARLYGNLLMAADRPAEAAKAYELARDRMGAGADWSAWLQVGSAQEKAGRWDLARPALERAVALGPDQPVALNYLGYSLADRGEELDRAQALLERANALAPDQPSIIDSLAWAYFRRGDRARALPLLEKAARGSPANGEISDHLGDAYWAAGRYFEARYAWRAALALADDAPDRARLAAKLLNGPAPHS